MRGFLPDKAGRDPSLIFARVLNRADWKRNHTFTEKKIQLVLEMLECAVI